MGNFGPIVAQICTSWYLRIHSKDFYSIIGHKNFDKIKSNFILVKFPQKTPLIPFWGKQPILAQLWLKTMQVIISGSALWILPNFPAW